MGETRSFIYDGRAIDIIGFTVHAHIGKGANADVFLASDNILGREVAIKIWRRKASNASSRALEETRKLAAIKHPNFAQIYQFSTVSGFPYAVMELIRGTTLKSWLASSTEYRSRPLIWRQLSSAMKHLYSTGVLHGDPHTGNIMLSSAPIGYSVPPLVGSYVPRPETIDRVTILDTGTSHFWRKRADFEKRERTVLIETVDRLFGHCLSKAVVVPIEATLEEILMIGDLLAVVFAAACAGPPRGSENMLDEREEMEYVASRIPSYMSEAVHLSYIRNGHVVAQIPRLKLQHLKRTTPNDRAM